MDWNKDGHLDILSGCYWTDDADGGYIQVLTGNGTTDFAAAITLTNSSGGPLLNEPLAEQDADESMASNQIQTICTHQHAVDYDGDGDLDIVNGCFGRNFYLYSNDGTEGEIALSHSPVRLPVAISSHHAAPHLVDWDEDGDLDLLSGTSNGGVVLSENTGSRTKPEWSDFQTLIAESNAHTQRSSAIVPAPSTRVWAADWNHDGLPDLLVGDSVTISDPREGITTEEYNRRDKESEAASSEIMKRLQPLQVKYSAALEAGEEPDEELQESFESLSEELRTIMRERSGFENTHRTGFVWLYLRRPTKESHP